MSEKCGVSYVALSKIERNQGNPELRTLDRIGEALGVSVHDLLAQAEGPHPIRAREESCKVLGKGDCRVASLGGTRILFVRAPKGATGTESRFHGDDCERCFVLSGRLKVTVRGKEYVLGAGDALAWDTAFEHCYEVLEGATFITVLCPKRL